MELRRRGGANVKVTSQNRRQYVEEMIRHRFQVSTSIQMAHFAEGFGDILLNEHTFHCFSLSWLLKTLIACLVAVRVTYLSNTGRLKDYTHSDPQIIWFWKVCLSALFFIRFFAPFAQLRVVDGDFPLMLRLLVYFTSL